MILKQYHRARGFTMIDNEVIVRPDLSAKAKGVLLYLMSRPENWKISVADIVSHMKEGRDGIRAAVQELRHLGYMKLDSVQDEDSGQLVGSEWSVADYPAFVEENPNVGETRESENPTLGKSDPISNTNRKNKGSKKEGSTTGLFGEEFNPDALLPFEDTPLKDFPIFEKLIMRKGLEQVDLEFYHGRTMDWSISKEGKIKRSVKGWLGTARNIMRSDVQEKKLKLKSSDDKIQNDQNGAIEFLKM